MVLGRTDKYDQHVPVQLVFKILNIYKPNNWVE